MERKGWLASTLLAAFCAAGIITLVSQVAPSVPALDPAGASTRTDLDPGTAPLGDLGEVVPLGLRKGAELQSGLPGEEEPDPVLRLR